MVALLRCVDASYAQPQFNWTRAAAEGIAVGIAKRSEGTAGVDPQFDYHWKAIKDAGLARGAYSFARWDLGLAPADEAHWFLWHLPPLESGDFVVLDLENSPAGVPGRPLSSWALAWLSVVEHDLGVRPLLYSGAYFASQYLTDPRLAPYGKWVAAYGASCPVLPEPWMPIALWQHTSGANVAGMSVDESYFFGSLDQLRAYGKPAPPSAPTTVVSHGTGARYLVTRTMMARTKPSRAAVRLTATGPQWVNRGAVLQGTGQQTPHWVQVDAGGKPTWIWLANTQRV